MQDRRPQTNSDADNELLSAYLDDELSAVERISLERRLQREPELRQALEELRATVSLVRELPNLTPPRSFTLDLASLPRQRRVLFSFAQLRIATSVVALLFVLTLTPNLLELRGMGAGGAPVAAPMPASTAAFTAAPPQQSDALRLPQATQAPSPLANADAAGMTSLAPGGGEAPPPPAPAVPAPTSASTMSESYAVAPTNAAAQEAAPDALRVPAPESAPAAPKDAPQPAATAPPQDVRPQQIPAQPSTSLADLTELPASVGWLLIAQMVLLVLTVGLAAVTYWAYLQER